MQFSRDERELSGAELARRLKVPRASIFRLLHTLEQLGFVERVGDSTQYRLGVAVLRLGFETLASMELTEHGRPVLDTLRDATGYSAHLVVRDGREVVFVAKAAGHHALFHSIQVGARLPAHATVLGRILLAGMGAAGLGELFGGAPLRAYTAHTPTSIKKLKALIDQHQTQGYAISQSGFETGISTIAAPVFDDRRTVIAAISITVPAQQIEAPRAAALAKAVQQAAAQLSARISHQTPRDPQAHPQVQKLAA
jgi:DNA-binding IclR family transcriptional regulator